MYLNDLLIQKSMSKYRLSKESGVPQATISDICRGKAHIEKCSADTVYRLAKALGVPMENLIEEEMQSKAAEPKRQSFEIFKSAVCHLIKDKGDIDFIIDTLKADEIRALYNRKWYAEAFYLLAAVDYLSRENSVPMCANYNDIRNQRLKETIYPTSAVLSDMAMNTNKYRSECMKNAIPEFLNFNIVESDIRNVF